MIFLIGRHGSGKSTIASSLVDEGYQHLSIGMLRRLAKSKVYPADVPAVIISALARTGSGPLPSRLVERIISFASGKSKIVIDGLPSSTDQLKLLPANATVCYVWAGKLARQWRLQDRAQTTVRQWTPGKVSVREENLASVVLEIRGGQRLIFVNNSKTGLVHAHAAAQRLLELDRSPKNLRA